MSGSTARSDLAGPGITIDGPLAPGFERAPVAFVVDGVAVAPRVLAHRWDPDFTETVYALTDALRLTERKGIRGDVLCADWRFEGSGRVDIRGPATERGQRISLSGGAAVGGNLHERPFADWLARHAPRLHTASSALAARYAGCWFAVYRDAPAPLALRLRDLRWMRAPAGVEERLAGPWDGEPYTPAIEFAEHHPLAMAAARDRALDAVLARGGFAALPAGLADAVWHWGMVRSLGGPDLRDAVARAFLHDGYFRDAPAISWASVLPFALDDFGARERLGLAQAVDALDVRGDAETSWVLHALGAVAARTGEAPLAERYARLWTAWSPGDGSAWLDTFFRAGVVEGLVDAGPLRVDGVPWKEDEISLERDGPGGPARVTGSRRSNQRR